MGREKYCREHLLLLDKPLLISVTKRVDAPAWHPLWWSRGLSTSHLLAFWESWPVFKESTSCWALSRHSWCQAFPVCFTVGSLFSEPLPDHAFFLLLWDSAIRSVQNWWLWQLIPIFLSPLAPATVLPFGWLGDPMSMTHSQPWPACHFLDSPLPADVFLSQLQAPTASPGLCRLELFHLWRHLLQTWLSSVVVPPVSLLPRLCAACWGLVGTPACRHLVLCLFPLTSNPPAPSFLSAGHSLATFTGSCPPWPLILPPSLSGKIPIQKQNFYLTLLETIAEAPSG